MVDGRIRLRSYRLAFELERRIHRIDTFRIPLPYGLPLASLGWAGGVCVAIVALRSAPLVGAALGLLPWPVRLICGPALVAHLLCRPTGDGRPVHEALVARVTRAARPTRLAGLERVRRLQIADLAAIPVVPDERMPEYRQGVVQGPGNVQLRQPAALLATGTSVRLTGTTDSPMLHARELRLRHGQRLVIG
jgi:hypothetical protein